MIEAILVIGWRSDAGAYLVDIYPTDYEVDGQDLTNIFSVHRMAANGIKERATQDFNYIRLFDGRKLVSWYSGFNTTKFLVEPNFCVSLILSPDENPNKWEALLHIIAYNVLHHFREPDFMDYCEQLIDGLNQGYEVQEEDGYPGLFIYGESENGLENLPPLEAEKPKEIDEESTESIGLNYESEFDELLALAEDQSGGNGGGAFKPASSSSSDPFSSSSDPFGSSSSSDPFAKSSSDNSFGSSSSADSDQSLEFTEPNLKKAPEAQDILKQLEHLDKKMPRKPSGEDKEALFNHIEKKVAFLEQKIEILSGLLGTLQRKEVEVNEKNDLIAKLLALLS